MKNSRFKKFQFLQGSILVFALTVFALTVCGVTMIGCTKDEPKTTVIDESLNKPIISDTEQPMATESVGIAD